VRLIQVYDDVSFFENLNNHALTEPGFMSALSLCDVFAVFFGEILRSLNSPPVFSTLINSIPLK